MDITFQTLLPAFGLGLLGFVEPCTLGAHVLFLEGQRHRPAAQRMSAALVFLMARIVVMGGFGGLVVLLGQRLVGVQTGMWLVFGAVYLSLGTAICQRRAKNRPRGGAKPGQLRGGKRHDALACPIAGAWHGALARGANSSGEDQVAATAFRARLWPSR